MRSFRLDSKSVSEVLEHWAPYLVATVVGICLGYWGYSGSPTGRVAFIIVMGCCVGFAVRGRAAERLREKYPGSRCVGLLSAGLTVISLGVAARMVFPRMGTSLDMIWLLAGGVCVAVFLFINRKNPTVFK